MLSQEYKSSSDKKYSFKFFTSPSIMFIILTFILPFLYTTSGLGCYKSYEEQYGLCSRANQPTHAYSAEECCQSTHSAAYSTEDIPTGSRKVKCQPCKTLRENKKAVYCFQTIYYLVERSCHELHSEMTSIVDCCGSHKEEPAQGFNFKQSIMNSTVPTYKCIPCKEAIFNASEWTAWSSCSVSCGGGIKKRESFCKEDIKYLPHAICIDETSETKNCNDHSCPESMSNAMIALIVVTSLLSIVLIVVIMWKCYKKRQYPRSSTTPQFSLAYKSSELKPEATPNKYHTTPMKRELPIIPSEHSDFHMYSDIHVNEDDNSGYMPMNARKT